MKFHGKRTQAHSPRRFGRAGLWAAAAAVLALSLGAEVLFRAASGPGSAGGPADSGAALSWSGELDTEYLDYYGVEPFQPSLPVIYIDTEDQIEKENKVWASVGVLEADPSPEAKTILEGPDQVLSATIKMRGASSYSGFEKKQYRLKFYRRQGGSKERDYGLLGMAESSEWVLNGPYLDKTLLRNRLAYQTAHEIFEWAPDTRYCELILNGRYLGVYLAVEPVTADPGRLALGEYGLLSGETAYLVKRDRIGTENVPLETYGSLNAKTLNRLYVEYPSAKRITDTQLDWIQRDLSLLERCLYGGVGGRPSPGYGQYIDVNNFADYFIFNEFCMNHDAGNLSTYAYKNLSGKLKLAVWDYNNAFDNYQWFPVAVGDWLSPYNSWFDQLIKDEDFVDRIQKRYKELRRGPLDEEHLYAQIEQFQAELGEAVERNYAVWGCAFYDSFTNEPDREIHSYEEAVAQLKDCIHNRLAFMDAHLTELYEFCRADEAAAQS